MSETKHYIGKLTPTGKALKEFDPSIEDKDELEESGSFILINDQVYIVQRKKINAYDDIYKAKKNDDGSIDFDVKYYNGGCGFVEAVDEALDNL